jgi:outer membrane immunogenic protein
VVGLEGDISWTNKDETRKTWITTARLRFGYTWDRTLVYATGGLAAANVQSTVTIPVLGFPISNGAWSDSRTLFGWTAGGGIEYVFMNNCSLKAEYLYVRLENRPMTFLQTPVAAVPRIGLNLDNNIVRVGLNWRYGG